jgi:hypothetical protein
MQASYPNVILLKMAALSQDNAGGMLGGIRLDMVCGGATPEWRHE